MLIHTPSKRVLLNLSDPARVTTVIPTAKTFDYKGSTLVAVPHRLEEARVLRNMGFPTTPSPIKHYYSWPGRFTPFSAQLDTAEFLTFNPRAFVLNDLGTGKTLAALWAFDYLRSLGLVKKLLVISPLSTLERTWADEVFKHLPHLSVGVVYGTKERRRKVLADDYDVYLINHDGIKIMEPELIARQDIDVVAVDEIASFRTATTQRWKCLNRIIKGKEWVWGLTGTPTPNKPTDAWAQVRLISPERVPKFFGAFRDSVMKQNGPFRWTARDGATETVARAMQPAIRFSRDECVDLPPVMYQDRHVPMSPDQKSAYKTMVSQLMAEHDHQKVVALNEAVKMSKLVQIACGVVYDSTGKEVLIGGQGRTEEVIDIVEQAANKVIVFVPYKAVLHYVADALVDHFGNAGQPEGYVARLSGETPKGERDMIFRDFQQSPLPRVLVAQPAAMSHGLTLTEANVIVWYSAVYSQETYAQANGRITRPGQKLDQFIINLEGSEVERRIYKSLKAKEKLEGLLLSLIQDER